MDVKVERTRPWPGVAVDRHALQWRIAKWNRLLEDPARLQPCATEEPKVSNLRKPFQDEEGEPSGAPLIERSNCLWPVGSERDECSFPESASPTGGNTVPVCRLCKREPERQICESLPSPERQLRGCQEQLFECVAVVLSGHGATGVLSEVLDSC